MSLCENREKAKKRASAAVSAALAILYFLHFVSIPAKAEDIPFYCAAGDNGAAVVYPQKGLDGGTYLFLPAGFDISSLELLSAGGGTVTLTAEGKEVAPDDDGSFDLSGYLSEGQEGLRVSVSVDGENTDATVMRSGNIPALFLESEDPAAGGRAWVDSSKSHTATGSYALLGQDGKVTAGGVLTQIKARGNSTFNYFDKKPYQIKLEKKADLTGSGKREECKKWILLANALDATQIHNSVTFRLAADCGLDYTSKYVSVDLYYDGEYRGVYLLCEKTEVGPSRIDIEDTDELIEEANADTDAYRQPRQVTVDMNGAPAEANTPGTYRYIDGLEEPPLAQGADHHGFLLEVDHTDRMSLELTGFMTSRGQAVTTANPEYLTKGTGEYIARFFGEFEDAVYSPDGYNEATGKYYYDYCDLASLVRTYLVNELSKCWDCYESSCYFYLPEDSSVMYAGPVWDYDLAYGNGVGHGKELTDPRNFFAAKHYIAEGLIKIQSFRDALQTELSGSGAFRKAALPLFGEDGYIKTLASSIESSVGMNYRIWDIGMLSFDFRTPFAVVGKDKEITFRNTVDFLENYLSERFDWLTKRIMSWHGDYYSLEDGEAVPKSAGKSQKHLKASPVDGFYLGDADMNGFVNAADARLALRHAAKLELLDGTGVLIADMNGDGAVTATDARSILRAAAGLD